MPISNLSDRQKKLLCAVIEEYIEEAKPIGSQNLVAKCKLEVSPATVRNEMVRLLEEGLLDKPHSSAGRVPTTMGIRLYLSDLMREEELPVIEEVSLKQRLWPQRFSEIGLWYEGAMALADSAKNLAVVLAGDYIFSAGAVSILENPEFFDIDVTRTVLHLLDRRDLLSELFSKVASDREVHTLLGSELGLTNLLPCGLVFARFGTKDGEGSIGVLGPNRMDYARVLPRVRYMAELLSELSREW